jgi:hypothetical protein
LNEPLFAVFCEECTTFPHQPLERLMACIGHLGPIDGSVWLDELLCGLGRAVEDVQPFLASWEACRAGHGYEHLIGFLGANTGALLKKMRLSNCFWSDAETQMKQVINWLTSPETERKLQQIFDENPDSDFAAHLARAIDALGLLRHSLAANRGTPMV